MLDGEVTAVSTKRIILPALFQARLPGGHDDTLTRAAAEIKATSGLPFMDAMNVALLQGTRFDDRVLKNVMFQNQAEARSWYEIDDPALTDLALHHEDETSMTALTSEVRLRSGEAKHLAMMDFHVPASDEALKLVAAVAREVGGRGWILTSGRSYHYYGSRLLAFSEMCAFLGRSLLFAPITDRAWIAHQLIDGGCCLRIGGHPSKIGMPTVVAETSDLI